MNTDVPGSLVPALTALIVPVVLAWLLRGSRRQARVEEQRLVVEYGRGPRILAAVFLAITLFIAFAASKARPDQRVMAGIVVGFFVLGMLVLMLEFFRVRIEFDDAEIRCFSPWRRRRVIPWAAVESITFSAVNSWWVAHSRDHGKVRLSQYLTGSADFIAAAKARGIAVAEPPAFSPAGR